MKAVAKMGLAAVAASVFSMTAAAGDGVYISGSVKNSTLAHTIERNTGTNTTPSITTRSEETDFGLGLALGYKTHIDNTLFVGIEMFYNEEDVQTRNLNNLLITEVDLTSTYGINLKGGFDITEKFSLYGKIGAAWIDFDLNNSYPFAPPMTSASETENEISYGFGVGYALSNNLSVVGEYTQITDLDFSPIPEVAVPGKINPNELDLSSWQIGVSYSF